MVAPAGSESLFASMLMPSVSSSPEATVYEHTSFFASSPVEPLRAQVAVFSEPEPEPTRILS